MHGVVVAGMRIREASALVGLLLAFGGVGCSDGAAPAPWNGRFGEPVARPEHPRPDFRRDSFINLNTSWQFAYDPGEVGVDEGWFDRADVFTDAIQVPYAWDAPASGLVDAPDGYHFLDVQQDPTYRGVAWYRLALPGTLPADAGKDWYLVFGAVDFHATVWVNGELAAEHEGGYTPFALDLSAHVPSGRAPVIVVRAEDRTELAAYEQPVGKQGGLWYTRTSGIWQTVYLEQRPATHLTALRIVPEPSASRMVARLQWAGGGPVAIRLEASLDGAIVGTAEATGDGGAAEVTLDLDEVRLWDHASPTLYDLDVQITGDDGVPDVVHGYFGLVTVGTDWVPGHSPGDTSDPQQQYRTLTVNGRPVYLRCVLDQSYWPDGVYTAPSMEAIRTDLERAKAFGFNCVRVHIKVDEPVKYRLLDELGLYTVYDMPSLDQAAHNGPGFPGRAHFADMMREAIARDASHPGIVAWVVFNENWGLSAGGGIEPLADDPEMQDWVREMVDLARSLDPTRPVEDNSAGGVVQVFEHIDTDLDSFHFYGKPDTLHDLLAEQAPLIYPGSPANYVGGEVQTGAPWWNSEFGAVSAIEGPADEEDWCDVMALLNELRLQPKLVGHLFTQLTDVEWEQNGLYHYDRTPKDAMCTRYGVSLPDLLGADFVAVDWRPGHALAANGSVSVPVLFSQWSSDTARSLELRARFDDGTPVGVPFTSAPYDATAVAGADLVAPSVPGDHVLVLEVVDGAGDRVSANALRVSVQ